MIELYMQPNLPFLQFAYFYIEPEVWQAEEECGCMAVLRYWQLFHGNHYNLNGEEARARALKYYDRDNKKGVEGTENCNEEQTKCNNPHKHPKSYYLKTLTYRNNCEKA